MFVRDTVDADIPAIFSIRLHPKVAASQFRLAKDDTPDKWIDWLAGRSLLDCNMFRCSSIMDGDRVIGYITQRGTGLSSKRTFSLGFNLLPNYWGRGLMRESLFEVISVIFNDHSATHVTSACFRNNTRCARLLAGLGFRHYRFPLARRARIAYTSRCLKWIHFHYTELEAWQQTAYRHSLQTRVDEHVEPSPES